MTVITKITSTRWSLFYIFNPQVEWSSNNGTLPGPVDNTCGLEEGNEDEEEEEEK